MQRLNHARLIEDGHRHAVQIRKDYKMRTFITAMAIASLAVAAPAQAIAKGKRQQQDAPKAEDQAKKRVFRKSCGCFGQLQRAGSMHVSTLSRRYSWSRRP